MMKNEKKSYGTRGEYLVPQIKVMNLRIRTNIMVNSPVGPNDNEGVDMSLGEW